MNGFSTWVERAKNCVWTHCAILVIMFHSFYSSKCLMNLPNTIGSEIKKYIIHTTFNSMTESHPLATQKKNAIGGGRTWRLPISKPKTNRKLTAISFPLVLETGGLLIEVGAPFRDRFVFPSGNSEFLIPSSSSAAPSSSRSASWEITSSETSKAITI